MTERLYYTDASLLAFDATVIAHAGDAKHVVLDRTAFYPTSGGQPHDTGRLGDALVLDVVDGDEQIVHVVDRPVPLGPILGEVDARRRRDHMQQHTAQHLLSAIAADQFGWETESVHFGGDHSTIEFATGAISQAQLDDVEARANAVILEARPVTVTFEEPAAALAHGLRKPPARAGLIRVITIADIDRSACGGTHVASTAAIGAVALGGIERLRGHLRVGFLAGARVLTQLHRRDALATGLAQELSCAVDELAGLVPKRQEELRDVRARLERLERELAGLRVRALVDAASPDAAGVRRVAASFVGESPAMLRAMAQAAGGMERVVIVLTDPPAILVGAGPHGGVDAGVALKAALADSGGRGGGNANVAQGTIADPAQLARVAAAVLATGTAT